VIWADALGALRRGDELVAEVELLAAGVNPAAALGDLAAGLDPAQVTRHDADRLEVVQDGVSVGIRGWSQDDAEARLLQLTGSSAHLDQLRAVADHLHLALRPDGLYGENGARIAASEPAIYEALGLPFVEPELRQGTGEIAAAQRGELPHLVARSDIRGDLHMHTNWSDGRDSVDAMVGAAVALGYEYIAITDHSKSSGASRNLAEDDVARQRDEIAEAAERYPFIKILHGCEVDILGDGTLDFPDRVLERFDIVLASLHNRPEPLVLDRLELYRLAMRHPLVSIVTHPSNRLFPRREGYDLDLDALFETAVETGAVLEIDGAPSHLDLDAASARRAKAAGVMLAIDSDAHRTEALHRHMRLGLLVARQAWVPPTQVLNTRPFSEITERIAAKRRGKVL
jgi:DNA polymerase (family 10)